MIVVGAVLVSEAAVMARFGCDLQACHGACCRVGDAGSPLGEGEAGAILEILPEVLPELTAESRLKIQQRGFSQSDGDGGQRLVCHADGQCVFAVQHGDTRLDPNSRSAARQHGYLRNSGPVVYPRIPSASASSPPPADMHPLRHAGRATLRGRSGASACP